MKRSIRSVVALVTIGLLGACAMAQAPVPDATAGHGAHQPAGAAAKPEMMGGDMKGMMAKMSPEMKMCCQMCMNTAISPSDAAAILALKDQLKLTEDQTAQLEAINKDARDKAAAVLTADQKKTLDVMPKSPQTMKDMHERMMEQMKTMMGGKMGDQPMSCPMMQMMKGQMGANPAHPEAGMSAEPDHAAHH